ncbi:MAG TPA: hypothetical protein VE713_06025 [Pyrinomonadaceae bacterium]|jgi:glucose/arabinose dehydrogenase|nr:hypothetical protein [Pyrinomonadaceae bacterium]
MRAKPALLITLILSACALATAQQPRQAAPTQPQQKPATQESAPEVPAAWAEAVQKAQAEAELLKAKAEAAQARAEGLLYQVMALLKLSPAEWRPVLDAKGLRFERVTPSPSPPK